MTYASPTGDASTAVQRGSCHCGDLRFEVDGDLDEVPLAEPLHHR